MAYSEHVWLGLLCPDFADVFVWGETLEGLEPTGEAVGRDKVVEVAARQVPAISQALLCNSKQEANNRAS